MKRSAVLGLFLFFIFVFVFTSCKTENDGTASDTSSFTEISSTDPGESGAESATESTDSSGSSSAGGESETPSQTSSKNTSSAMSSASSRSTSSNTSSVTSSSNTSSNTSSHTSMGDTSSEPQSPTYLSVIDCVMTDNNCFVIVGKCEEGASVTAITDTQRVTVSSDKGFYSVRLKKFSSRMQVQLEAKGKITEKYTYSASPKTLPPDSWPIVAADGYNFFFLKMMPDFMQTNRLSDSMIQYITQKTRDRVNYLKQALPDTEIIYMVVPSKASTYPERVPSDYKQGTGKSRLEQVNEAFEAGGVKVINLLDVFKKHKNDQYKLYWNTDSHWTDYGAFVAYTELFNYISKSFPQAAPRKMQEFDFRCEFFKSGDMMMYQKIDQNLTREYNCLRVPKFNMNKSITSVTRYRAPDDLVYNDQVTYERTIINGNTSLPNLYVIRDSYCAQIYDILAERSNTTFYKAMWNYTYNISEIKKFAPDYIIYLVAEWNIDVLINN